MLELTANQVIIARQNGYKLLSRLFLEGLTAELLPYIMQVDELTAVTSHAFNADESAASYQNTFGFNIFPFASIFLDASGLLGGAVTDAVVAEYQQGGFAVQSDADHIGHELSYLAHLCQVELDVLADNTTAVLPKIYQLQINFIKAQLLPWLPTFAIALQRCDDKFFSKAADLTLAIVVDHAATLLAMGFVGAETAVLNQHPPQNLLENDKTSLKDIARYLVTPPYSGIYLSRDTISKLARQLSLPRGFGNRQQMLLNLLRAAAEYDLLHQAVTDLITETAVWQTAYHDQQTTMPPLNPYIFAWTTRTKNTIHILETIRLQSEKIDN